MAKSRSKAKDQATFNFDAPAEIKADAPKSSEKKASSGNTAPAAANPHPPSENLHPPGLTSSIETREPSPFKEKSSDLEIVPVGVAKPQAEVPPVAYAPSSTPDLRGKTVWAIDSMSLIFQVFHGMPPMTSPTGLPVNAVFGFTRDMFTVLENKKPDYLFCGFDLSGPTFRHELFAEYKQNRSDMPEDLIPQIPLIRRVLETLQIPILELPAYEADDLLATLARIVDEAGGKCYLITADKDYRQLITERVKLYNMRKNQTMDAEALIEDWGIRPDQVIDYQTLVGDPVDNIPGVPMIGPKSAKELLQQFDSLDGIYKNLDKIKGDKKKQNLTTFEASTKLARQLVRLETHCPIEIPWQAAETTGFCFASASELFAELGFRSLTNKMREQQLLKSNSMAQETPATRSPTDPPSDQALDLQSREDAAILSQIDDGPTSGESSRIESSRTNTHNLDHFRNIPVKYETIDTPERLQWLADEMAKQQRISFDTETTAINPRWAEIVGMSFSWAPAEGYYIPIRAPEGERQLDEKIVVAALRPVLENPKISKIGQNLKYDWIMLRSAGIDLKGAAFDTMVASYLLDAGERNHNIDELAARYLNHKTTKINELIGTGKKQILMNQVPVAAITHYAAEDADIPVRLQPLLQEKLEQQDLVKLNNEVEVPLIEVLVELEYNGIKVNGDHLRSLSGKYTGLLAALEQEIYQLAGHEFNIASPKQLQQVLFTEQNLRIVKRTKTGPSTDVEVLEELASEHPLPAKIIEYRQFSKLKNTYVDSLPELIHPRTGRVHSSFNQVVAATGRLSSNDPNLQNIPIRTEAGREIRAAFLPGYEGWKLIAADYSQIELRVLAHYCGDETLSQSFERDEDIHARVASQVFGVPLEAVDSAQRRVAKAVNFGIIYGQSPFGLAKALDIPQQEAARFIDAYFKNYPGVEKFMNQVLVDCYKQGYVSTILGRRRAINGVREPNPALLKLPPSAPQRGKNMPERTAVNTVIQGSAADLIKLAMISIYKKLRDEKYQTKMLLQIHDELVFEAPPEEIDRVSQLILDEMSSVMKLSVPLKVDLKVGNNWDECE